MENKIVIVIAAFNEKTVIRSVLEELIGAGYTVVVVDDGSTDGTHNIAGEFPLFLLRHVFNLGQGAALQTGIEYALQNLAPTIIVTFDADGQHSTGDIQALIAPIENGSASVVFGSRFQGRAFGMPLARKISVRFLSFATSRLIGCTLSDTNCGLRAISASAAREINISQSRMAHSLEIVSKVTRLEIKYVEVLVSICYNDYTVKKGQRLFGVFEIFRDFLFKV